MPTSRRTLFLYASLASLAWIALVSLLFHPIFQQPEEISIQYRLTGADGLPASYLAHYNHVWHYWLSYPVFKAQQVLPHINLYAVFLLLLQWMALTVIGYTLLQGVGLRKGGIFFFLYLLFIETAFLQRLGLTGTSIQLSVAGIILLSKVQITRPDWAKLAFPFSLLILAGMVRMHTLALVMLATAPYLFYKSEIPKAIRLSGVLIIVSLFTVGLNTLHVRHYERNIPGWTEQENLKQSFFRLYNRPVNFEKSDGKIPQTADFLKAGVIWDTQYVSVKKLDLLFQTSYQPRTTRKHITDPATYWLVKNNLYLIALYAILFFYTLATTKTARKKIILSTVWSGIISFVLFTWFKLTGEMIQAMLGLNLIWLFYQLGTTAIPITSRRHFPILKALSLAFFSFWGIRVAIQMSNMNETKSKNWTSIQTEINQYPKDFFILIQDQAITRAYSIWEYPADMPCKNLLDRYRMILSQKTYVERYYEVVKQYPNRKRDSNIFLVGDSIRFFQTAYPNLKLSPPLPGFKSMNVRRVER